MIISLKKFVVNYCDEYAYLLGRIDIKNHKNGQHEFVIKVFGSVIGFITLFYCFLLFPN